MKLKRVIWIQCTRGFWLLVSRPHIGWQFHSSWKWLQSSLIASRKSVCRSHRWRESCTSSRWSRSSRVKNARQRRAKCANFNPYSLNPRIMSWSNQCPSVILNDVESMLGHMYLWAPHEWSTAGTFFHHHIGGNINIFAVPISSYPRWHPIFCDCLFE